MAFGLGKLFGGKRVITVHHLNNSRSQRVLWLLEELGLDYEIVHHERDLETNLAPPSLLEVHPLGKSPVVVDGDETIIESGAIIDLLTRKYGKGKLAPAPDAKNYSKYVQLLHYAEGSAMLPIMLRLYAGRLGEAAGALMPRIDSETANHFGFLNGLLEGQDFFLGNELSAADIQMSFAIEAAGVQGQLENFANLQGFLQRIKSRPAYKRALERGGPYVF